MVDIGHEAFPSGWFSFLDPFLQGATINGGVAIGQDNPASGGRCMQCQEMQYVLVIVDGFDDPSSNSFE